MEPPRVFIHVMLKGGVVPPHLKAFSCVSAAKISWLRNFPMVKDMSLKSVLSFVLAAAAVPGCSFAQESTTPRRPKIGLVLEGGAALGLAHIGVLRWLEEHRIPVSYVAGTSMGGLVGGLYATGHSPEDCRKLIEGVDWGQVLGGQTPFEDLVFRRKEDERDYPNSMEFGLREGIRFPEGFNSGHQVGLILDRVSLPYSEVKSFDELPIPFACVGTDLVSRKDYVFREGSLSQALRSTMSLPGIFSPVRTEGHIFADGGLLNNLPVDVAKSMGADLVIAVHLQVKPLDPQEHLSSFGVLGTSISVVVAANEIRSMQKADILITVPLAEYASTDYEKGAAIIEKGYQAATTKAAILSGFGVDEGTWQAYLKERNSRLRSVPIPQFVEVTDTKPQLAAEIQKKLSSNVNQPVDPEKLGDQLTEFTGVGRFTSLGYRMIEKNGQQGLLVVAQEKPYGPPIVRPLLILDSSNIHVGFKFGARVTFFDVGRFGTEWRNDVVLGSERGIASEFYRPFGKGLHWFVAPRGYADSNTLDLYRKNTLTAEYRDLQAGGAMDFGYAFGRRSEVRVGYESAHHDLSPRIGDPSLGSLSGRSGVSGLRYSLIGIDDAVIPRSGINLYTRVQWYDANPGATTGFPLAEARLGLFKRVSEPSSIFIAAEGGSTLGHAQEGIPAFNLGGGTPDLAAYGQNELFTNQYYLFRGGYIRQMLKLPPLLGDQLYLLVGGEVAKVFYNPAASNLPMDAFVAGVVKTIFGPVMLGGSIGDTGHHRFFLRMGRVF
jgi:NTE family protein